ncbi:MAG: VOC family protein [Amphiplicatus sp.]
MRNLRPCLWFDTEAEEAAKFYVSTFKNSKLGAIARYGEEGVEIHGRPAGSVMTVAFELNGEPFLALNGGPHFKFNEAVSFEIRCKNQEEVDYYWKTLTANGGEEGPCGWLKDRFGLSWQVVPERLAELMIDPDKKKAGRVMNAMLKMKKIIVADLEKAAAA